MPKAASAYVITRTLALPAQGVPYLAIAQLGTAKWHRAHQHAEVQVLWALSGSMGIRFDDDEEVTLEVGTACVILANTWHVVTQIPRVDPTVQLIDLRITDDPNNPLRQFLASLGRDRRFDTQSKVVELAAHRLQSAASRGGLARHAGIMAALWELLGALADEKAPRRADADDATPATRDRRIEEAEEFCRHQLSSPLTVDDIASAVGLSRSQLSRLFHETYRIGPAERLRQLRVELARHLLSTTTLSIKEVAHACGFARANHFGRVFQQVTGTTAGQFRRGVQNTRV
ncbi:MAG TPA: AraC family transcriptional regulator [Tepidisphaeraceae bacterium]|jgi:AraC-like DNA-binding protein|nr:AraC family transcriptional regulator [Tepidisphaeraceae bacterium]